MLKALSALALALAAAPVHADVFLNAGGNAIGTSYVADQYFSGGSAYTFGNQSGVYNTERWSKTPFNYAIPVPPGTVQVTLRLRESCVPCSYVRRFNVTAEGQTVLSSFTVAPNTVSDQIFTVVSDATLNLIFTPVNGEAYVNAIEVHPIPPPTLSFTATPASVSIGAAAQLDWTSANTSGCTASGAWSGPRLATGSESTGALSASSSYTLTCGGAGGSIAKSASVAVLVPPTLTFTATPASVASGATSTLAWAAGNATGCTASGGWTGTKLTTGSQPTAALTVPTQFTLSCSGAGGTISKSVNVAIAASSAALLINAGGPALGDYVADRNFSGGQAYTFSNPTGVYKTERWSKTSFSYAIPVSPGLVQVTLKLRESCAPCSYVRRFNVTAEGQAVLSNFTVPPSTVSDQTFTLVSDATLDLVFSAVGGEAYVNAIEVRSQGPPPPPPAPTISLGATPPSVNAGTAALLYWTTSNATGCTAIGGWQGAKLPSGSQTTAPIAADTTFGLRCVGAGGTSMRFVEIGVYPTGERFPLHTEPGRRQLVDVQGRPFLLHGDSAWSLIAQLKREEIDAYLEDRRAKGFDAVLVNLLEHEFASDPPRNAYGDAPFLTPGDFSTPNEAYFAHAEYAIAKASEKGLLVLLTPAYLGFDGGQEGWYQELEANGVSKLRAYGEYLANRFGAYDNILWVHGGDFVPPEPSLVSAIAEGIVAVEPRWLHTFHGERGDSALSALGTSVTWLQVNDLYTDAADVVSGANREFARSTLPFFLIEGSYEGETADERGVRQQAYQTLLSGGSGQLMGNSPVWFFGNGWQQALASPGASTLMYLRSLLEANAWETLQPDTNASVLTGGLGSGAGRAVLARASDGSRALAYIPDARTVTVALGAFSGAKVQATWYDPTNGRTTPVAGSPFAASGSRSFTTPGSNSRGDSDWVLVLLVAF